MALFRIYNNGWNSASSMVALSIQPGSPGIMYPREIYTPGAVYDDGEAFTYWDFPFATPVQYAAILTECGLSYTVRSKQVTVSTIADDQTTFVTRNATIIRPRPEEEANWSQSRFRNRLRFRLIQLKATS